MQKSYFDKISFNEDLKFFKHTKYNNFNHFNVIFTVAIFRIILEC